MPTATLLQQRESAIASHGVSLTRIESLKLGREILRAFLNEDGVRPALTTCANAIARALPVSEVTISAVSDGEQPVVVSWTAGKALRPTVADDSRLPFECSVPIRGDDGNVGTLTVAGTSPKPSGVEPFLEEVALEIGRCLDHARVRTDASARFREDSALKPSTLIGVAGLDREHHVTTWNAGCREILGWPSDDVLGKDLSGVLGAGAYSQLEGSLQVAQDGRRPRPCRINVRRWDGRDASTSIEVLPVVTGSDREGELRLIIRDESRLSQLQRLVGVFSTVSGFFEGSSSIEAVASPLLRAICCGMGWLRGELWQFEPSDAGWTLIGDWNAGQLPIASLNLEAGQGLDRDFPQSVRERRGVVRFEELAADSRNPQIAAAARFGLQEAVGIPVALDGEVAGAMLFFGFEMPQLDQVWHDAFGAVASQIAVLLKKERFERKQREAEQDVAQSQKMEAVGLLAGGVAHDFNNLLTIILGSGEIALEMVDDDSPAAGFLREIENAGRRAADLTRQLLAFSRKQPLQAVVLDVNARVRDAEKMLRRLVDDRIELQIQPEEPLHRIKFDPVQFDQVLLNLVANARDAISGNGRIAVATRNEELSSAAARKHVGGRPGDFVVMSVSDTGCGMDEATLARIFEPFFTTKERGKGTGMGLATVHGIVNQGGGFLGIESRPGQGTTFSAFFPRTHDVPTTMQVDSGMAAQTIGTESILLVEDEDVLRSLAAQMLHARGYTVLQAAGGEEALQLLQRHGGSVDLLVSDVMMPGTTGPELASQVRSAGLQIPVLFISGYVDDRARGSEFPGADSPLLRKPFTSVELAAAVRRVLDGGELCGVVD
jgi:two-component system, cell cycle sensor histidine kinase and response regulator CckA